MPHRTWPVLATRVAAPVEVFSVYKFSLKAAAYSRPFAYTRETILLNPVLPMAVAAPVLVLTE
jgi:hypothetical protein